MTQGYIPTVYTVNNKTYVEENFADFADIYEPQKFSWLIL